MSVEVMSLVLSRSVNSSSKKLVLLCMADAANNDGAGIWKSAQTIADESDMSRRTVMNVWKDLENSRLIIRDGSMPVRGGKVTVWSINLEAIKALPRPCANSAQCETDDAKGVNLTAERCERDSHNPSINHPINQEGLFEDEIEEKEQPEEDRFEEAFALYKSAPLKAGQTKKAARSQWPKSVKAAGSQQRIIDAIKIDVDLRIAQKNGGAFVGSLPDMHRWLKNERWADAETDHGKSSNQTIEPDVASDAIERARLASEEKKRANMELHFASLQRHGEWAGDRHGVGCDPRLPEARYPADLYEKYNIQQREA